jgi:hypothetical protein
MEALGELKTPWANTAIPEQKDNIQARSLQTPGTRRYLPRSKIRNTEAIPEIAHQHQSYAREVVTLTSTTADLYRFSCGCGRGLGV